DGSLEQLRHALPSVVPRMALFSARFRFLVESHPRGVTNPSGEADDRKEARKHEEQQALEARVEEVDPSGFDSGRAGSDCGRDGRHYLHYRLLPLVAGLGPALRPPLDERRSKKKGRVPVTSGWRALAWCAYQGNTKG